MDTLDSPTPKNHAEAIAVFRAQVIGALCARSFVEHGELADALRALSRERFVAPGQTHSRRYAESTLERWLYAFRKGGIDALAPKRRSDAGYAQNLNEETRALLMDIRRERPAATASLILRTLIADGRLEKGALSPSTLRRFYREQGLDRASLAASTGGATRLRWEAPHVDALWHADVCHGPALRIGGRSVPLRIHAILDDHSRYVVAIVATSSEREIEMLSLLSRALLRGHAPDVLYLDNGPTYSGQSLATVCTRLGISLVHAKPHDPQARGKMERFWRTLRGGCLDHLGAQESLHDVQVRLLAFVDRHYHTSAHASLMGRSPVQVYESGRDKAPSEITREALAHAFTVQGRRRVRRDGTVEIGGTTFETTAGYLAGRVVTVARSLLEPTSVPWICHEDRRIELRLVDAKKNASRSRHERSTSTTAGLDTPFDPAGALLGAMLGKSAKDGAR